MESDNLITPSVVQEDQFNLNLWDYLTTFWGYLKDDDRQMFENYWQAMRLVSNELVNKATRLRYSSVPEESEENPIENYYEITLSPLTAKPLNPDPTQKGYNYIIRPINKILVEPQYNPDLTPIYRDIIEISAADYYKIREVGLNSYVVIKVNKDTILDKYFKIFNLLSSEEPNGRKQYAEIDNTFDTIGIEQSTLGKLALEGLYTKDDPEYVDISQYKVQIIQTVDPVSVTWGSDYLLINVNEADNSIDNIIAAVPSGIPWATFTNKSGALPRTKAPIFGGSALDEHAVEFSSLAGYKNAESANGRYYQGTGNIWKWYDGYSSLNGTVGTVGQGEWVVNIAKNKYIIVVEGDLSYIGSETFSLYLTTARSYDVDKYIVDIPYLHTYITAGYPIEFIKDRDYTFSDYVIEFNHDIFTTEEVVVDSIVYCQKTSIIEHYLYEIYGNLIGMSDWESYSHDNYSGKTAIACSMLATQNINNITNYRTALNAYYALPIAPKNCRVVGLYESYSYKILNIDGDVITVDIKEDSSLHPFIQEKSQFLVNNTHVTVASVDDRSLGLITLVDASGLKVNDELYLKLKNRFVLKSVHAETIDDAAYITVYCPEGPDAIQYLIDEVNDISGGKRFPEIIIYNTTHPTFNYNGIYHITAATASYEENIITLTLYKREITEEPLYNDYIGVDVDDIVNGSMHLLWPTHKFLYLQFSEDMYYKAYLDSPIDTVLDSDDMISKYQVLTRNASVFTKNMFFDWFQFDQFRRYNGANLESDTLEVTKIYQYAQFGNYFPSSYQLI